MRLAQEATPTIPQGAVLTMLATAYGTGCRTARDMHVRSDVLWRMNEAGWVAGGTFGVRTRDRAWQITGTGRDALDRYRRWNDDQG